VMYYIWTSVKVQEKCCQNFCVNQVTSYFIGLELVDELVMYYEE